MLPYFLLAAAFIAWLGLNLWLLSGIKKVEKQVKAREEIRL